MEKFITKKLIFVTLAIVSVLLTILIVLVSYNIITSKSNEKDKTQEISNSNLSSIFYNEYDKSQEVSDSNLPLDFYEETTIMSVLTDTYKKPIILYHIQGDNVSKDSIVLDFYILKDGKCRKYNYYRGAKSYSFADITLGELSKMTDDEIIEMLEEQYETNYKIAIQEWKKYINDKLVSGEAQVYSPGYFDIVAYLVTDSTGNRAVQEVIYLPKAGIADNPYVHYDDYDWHGLEWDSLLKKFEVVYFGRGFGTLSDIHTVNDIYCLTPSDVRTGAVYQSIYYGWKTSDSTWAKNGGTLIFRDENAFVEHITLDSLDSELIDYIDPSESDINKIMYEYLSAYSDCKKKLNINSINEDNPNKEPEYIYEGLQDNTYKEEEENGITGIDAIVEHYTE